MKKRWVISREQLLECSTNNIVDVKLAAEKLNVLKRIIKMCCREYKLRFEDNYEADKTILTTQCPIESCSWSGSFRFSTHMLKSNDKDHKQWLNQLIKYYEQYGAVDKVAELDDIKRYNITNVVIEKILKDLKALKKNVVNMTKCPISSCTWQGQFQLPKHIRESNDLEHNKFKEDVKRKYIVEKMSPAMIRRQYNISNMSVKKILKDLGVDLRSHHDSVITAIQNNRHNINAYGISGFRDDIGLYCRSLPEANFARILKYENINFKKEVPFNLFDENGNLEKTYFLDFLANEDQGFEIKGYGDDYDFKNKLKITQFTKQYPNIKLKVIFCSSQEWKDMTEKYSKFIPLWETARFNIRTNPESFKKATNAN